MKRVLFTALALASCVEASQTRLQVSLVATGSAGTSVQVADTAFALSRAEVAFGPAYFCATQSADPELCAVALLELRGTVRIDALSGESQELGTLEGTSGEIRSALYDYGISWPLTRTSLAPAAAAPEGHSAVLEGIAERAGERLHFRAALDVLPRARGDAAMNAQRTRHTLSPDGDVLRVRVDPLRWLIRVRPDALFALDADGDGEVVLAPGDQPYEAMLQALQSAAPLSFEWEHAALD
jgi:hypothetical protein